VRAEYDIIKNKTVSEVSKERVLDLGINPLFRLFFDTYIPSFTSFFYRKVAFIIYPFVHYRVNDKI